LLRLRGWHPVKFLLALQGTAANVTKSITTLYSWMVITSGCMVFVT